MQISKQELWKQAAEDLITESPVFGVLLAANLSTYLYGTITHKFAYIVHLYGPPGSGKTALLKAATSVGMSEVVPCAELTPLGLDLTISSNIVGAAALDDINRYLLGQHHVPYINVMTRLTMGELLSKKASYRIPSIAILTADRYTYIGQSSAAASMQGVCLRARLVEIDGNEHTVFPPASIEKLERYSEIFEDTKGSIEGTVQATVARHRQRLLELHRTHCEQYESTLPGEEDKKEVFAYIECGLFIIKELLGLNDQAMAGMRALLTRLVQKAVLEQFLRIPHEFGKGEPLNSWAVQVQSNVLTYGFPPGVINTTTLGAWPENFAPDLLESFKPGLADIVSYLADLPFPDRVAGVTAFLHSQQPSVTVELPVDLAE